MGAPIHKFFGIFLVLLRNVEMVILMCGDKKSKVLSRFFSFLGVILMYGGNNSIV
jgi:hypothetical protein